MVTIVLPVYNSELYLEKCLDSIINQTYRDFEVICVDDGSTDSSYKILSRYSAVDKRITIIESQHNNAGKARNIGMSVARGEYIIFLDSDDYFDENLLDLMVETIRKNSSDIVVCGSVGVDNNTGNNIWMGGSLNMNLIPQAKTFSARDIGNTLFQFVAGWPWDKIYRLTFLKENNIKFQEQQVANDASFVYKAFLRASKISIADKCLVIHRLNVNGSIENKKNKYWKCAVDMLEDLYNYLVSEDSFHYYENSYINFLAYYLVWYACTIDDRAEISSLLCLSKDHLLNNLNLDKNIKLIKDTFLQESINIFRNGTVDDFLLFSTNSLFKRCSDRDVNIGFLNKTVFELENRIHQLNQIKRWYFPEDSFMPNSDFVLYGFGKVGQDFACQLVNSKHSNLVAVIDKDYNTIDKPYLKDVKVGDLSILSGTEFDYVIISPRKEELAKEIRSELISAGVPEGKIICPVLDDKK